MRMVVVIICPNLDTLRLHVPNRSDEVMRVHDARVFVVSSVMVVGVLMDVLKRRDKECKHKCQACLKCQRATHH
jgi:hypothetical protein